MAALRSGMAMLGRRSCGGSGSSSAAAAMGGKGVRTAPSPLNTASVRNHESWRRFSTGGGEPKGKAGSFRRLWQWAKYRVENVDSLAKTRVAGAYALVAVGAPTFYVLNGLRNMQPPP